MKFANLLQAWAALAFLLLVSSFTVLGAPSSHIREEVTASYFPNGTMDGGVGSIGYIEVDVVNTADVLQSIVLELSTTTGTNLLSTTARKNVAASPRTGDRTRIYVNTTDGPQSLVYNITDPDIAAIIRLRLDYQNTLGGTDIHSGGMNTFWFNLTMNTTKDIYNVITNLRFSKDTLGLNDSMNIRNPSSSSGMTQRIDSDWDGFYDEVRWTGDLYAGSSVYFTFLGDITPDVNFDESQMMVDLDSEAQSTATASQDQTLTGITFVDRFSRGPIRQGVEILQTGTWNVRGFIKNIASGLDYIVHSWEMYRIGDPNPVASSSTSTYLNPNDQFQTTWYNTGTSAKQDYYASSFDWEVVWGASQYSGITDSRIYLPTLYEIDAFADKTVNLLTNTQSGRTVSVTDLLRHLGHLNTNVNDVNLMSRIPGSSTTGDGAAWSITSVQVTYSNSTGQYDITPYASVAVQNANPGQEGFVMVNITDLQSILGHTMGQNDDILLSYSLAGPYRPTTQDYVFSVQGVLITESGTPVTRNANRTLTIPGVYIPPPPGGPVGPVYPPPSLYATIEKELSDFRFITPEYVEINVTARVIDTGDKGIKDIKIMVYIPYDGSLDTSEVYLSVFHSSSGYLEQWLKDRDFTVTSGGVKTIGDQKYTEYVIEKKKTGLPYEETLILFNNDKVKVSYRARIPVGTNYILTRIFGYNYYEDKLIFEDIYTPVRREGAVSRFEITEGSWNQDKAIVGKPVVWKKEMVIYNPNNITVEEMIPVNVFKDVISVYLLEYGDGAPKRTRLKLKTEGNEAYADWIAKLASFETRIYAIEVTTPPVLETKEVLDVLESDEKTVKFSLNITLVNFALEDYYNVSFFLQIPRKDIISIRDDGSTVEFIDSGDGIEILLDSVKSNETRFLYIIYEQTPPVIITTLENLKYGCVDSVRGYVFIIPSERERGAYLEMEVIGPDPYLKTVHADLKVIGNMREFEEKRVPISFDSSSLGSGRYIIYTKFKRDFSTILYHQRDFVIDCPEREMIRISWVVFAVIAAAVIILLVFRTYRKKTYKKEIRELKKKIKGI